MKFHLPSAFGHQPRNDWMKLGVQIGGSSGTNTLTKEYLPQRRK